MGLPKPQQNSTDQKVERDKLQFMIVMFFIVKDKCFHTPTIYWYSRQYIQQIIPIVKYIDIS